MSPSSTTAFVPGHITGFFTVSQGDDPTETGSQGAGIALSDGVEVTVEPAEDNELVVNEVSLEMEAVERVLDALGVQARVVAETPLPVGCGFGLSGAIALGTALGANRTFNAHLSENELVTIAHGAEVLSGTGLGDVVAQARGGLPIRLEPGSPEHYLLDGIPGSFRIEYLSLGDIDTRDALAGEHDALNQAGKEALSEVVSDPTLTSLMYASRKFSREAGFLTDDLKEIIEDVSEAGGEAAMALLGETVFAPGRGLSDAGYDPVACSVDHGGARIVHE